MYNGNSTLRWVFFGLAFIVLIIAISSGIKSHKVNHPKKEVNKSKTESPKYKWVVTKIQTIQVDGSKYSKIYPIFEGEGLSIRNATQPYCVENESGHYVCVGKGEDATPQLPKEDKNREFKFITSNGTSGELTLVYWEKIKIPN